MWGHARDTDLRHHPQLRPFATLAPVDQMFNRQLTTGIVKHVLGRGFSFLPLGSGEELTLWSMRTDMSADEFNSVRDDLEATDISPDSQVARRRLNAAYTPQPYPTQHVQLPAATLELVDDVSSNLHEVRGCGVAVCCCATPLTTCFCARSAVVCGAYAIGLVVGPRGERRHQDTLLLGPL